MRIVPDTLHEWRLDVDSVDIQHYIRNDIENTRKLADLIIPELKQYKGFFNRKHIPNIKDVIFNDPATIVFWDDGTKTVVKAQDNDIFDPEKGLAMAITKKAFGNQGNYCEKIKPWLTGCDKQENTTNKSSFKNNKIKAVRYMLVNAMDLNKTKAVMRETINEAIHALGECVDD